MSLFSSAPLALLRKEAATRAIHKVETIDVWRLDPAFLDALDPKISRNTKFELVRSDGQLYVTLEGGVIESTLEQCSLVD